MDAAAINGTQVQDNHLESANAAGVNVVATERKW
jgi:hypothetical protein